MVTPTRIARQTLSKMRQMLSNDPLLHPLGRVPDSRIDAALAVRRLWRADLFCRGKYFAPHRHRLAEMLTVFHFSPSQIVAHHWRELKLADHVCARCADKKRCDRWLRGRGADDAPRRFCPNVTTFERWRRDYLQRKGAGEIIDDDCELETGLEQTREMLRRVRPQSSPSPTVSLPSPLPCTSGPAKESPHATVFEK